MAQRDRIGEYRIEGLLGRGGMGAVYLARRGGRKGERVAVKVLAEGVGLDASAERRFGHEVEIVRQLEHPHVVRALSGIEAEGGARFFVMEHVDGASLADVLREAGRLSVRQACAVLGQVLDGLAHAHERGVVHRDLKPANVLIDRSGTARITDFGIARALDMTRLTLSGQIVGSPAYMAPEQADGPDGAVDHRADIYAAGIILYEALVGDVPFRGPSPLAVLVQHAEAPLPETRLPDAVQAALRRALAKDPADRFPSAAAMREALARLGEGGSTADLRALVARAAASAEDVTRAPWSLRPRPRVAPGARAGLTIAAVALATALVGAALVVHGLSDGGSPIPPRADGAQDDRDTPLGGVTVRVVLRNGDRLDGVLVSATPDTIRIRTAAGDERDIPQRDVREVAHER